MDLGNFSLFTEETTENQKDDEINTIKLGYNEQLWTGHFYNQGSL